MMYRLSSVLALVIATKVSAVSDDIPNFRILAPQFVCPKDEDAPIKKPDDTVITLQTADPDLRVVWTVRWMLLNAPSQRFTLMLWRTVRALEKHLNGPQPEPHIYIIDNSKLLSGVDYLFNVTALKNKQPDGDSKIFNIDNTHGDNKLMIEGRNDMLSVILIGSQEAHVDNVFVVEAQITTCYPTQDYYFSWTIESASISEDTVDVSNVKSSTLEVAPYSLKAGNSYNANCKIIRQSNGHLVTETSMPFKVSFRRLEVYFNFDYLQISVNKTFSIESTVVNHDYYDTDVLYNWSCVHMSEHCTFLENTESDVLTLNSGLPEKGKYIFILTVTVANQVTITNVTVLAVSNMLPVIQIEPGLRVVNEGTTVNLVANATNVAPACTLSWYFASEEYLESNKSTSENSSSEDSQHGELLSDTVTIISLEEEFLNELTDFTNETEWRQVIATTSAASGRARFYAQCECSLTFGCETQGSVYADIWLKLNEVPAVEKVKISPSSGKAMETLYRISTLAAIDPQGPIKYSFYCSVSNNEPLLLATYVEFRALEIFLPFMKDGTAVWVEVCDTLSACTTTEVVKVVQVPGDGLTVDVLLMDAFAHAKRCEMLHLRRVVVSALVTYINTGQNDLRLKFIGALHEMRSSINNNCIESKTQEFLDMLYLLSNLGIDTT